jgi:hypothetical protein
VGLVLTAACPCGYRREGLRLGGTHAQIAAHDVSHYELFLAGCCREVQSVLLLLGQPLPAAAACERCEAPLDLATAIRYRVSTLKGERLTGHPCPRCGAPELDYEVVDRFV